MAIEVVDPTGVEYFEISNFTFASGVEIPVKVAYRSFNPTAQKTVLIPTCYGGVSFSSFSIRWS